MLDAAAAVTGAGAGSGAGAAAGVAEAVEVMDECYWVAIVSKETAMDGDLESM